MGLLPNFKDTIKHFLKGWGIFLILAKCFADDVVVKKTINRRFDKRAIALRSCPDLKRLEKDVYAGLMDFIQELPGWDSCRPSHETLAEHVGCSVRTIVYKLKSLRDKGFITWETRFKQPGYRDTNIYHLTDKILQYHPENVIPFPSGKNSMNSSSANFADEFRESNININKHWSGDTGCQDFKKDLKTTEKKEELSEEKKKESFFDSPQQTPPTPPLEEPACQSVDSEVTMKTPHWAIRPQDTDKDQIEFKTGLTRPQRDEVLAVFGTFCEAMKESGFDTTKLRLFEVKQVHKMIRDIGYEDALALMPWCVRNWQDLRSSPASKSDAEKLAHFPEPDFNAITAPWRYKMWRARMTGKYSERTRKRRAKKNAVPLEILENNRQSFETCFSHWQGFE